MNANEQIDNYFNNTFHRGAWPKVEKAFETFIAPYIDTQTITTEVLQKAVVYAAAQDFEWFKFMYEDDVYMVKAVKEYIDKNNLFNVDKTIKQTWIVCTFSIVTYFGPIQKVISGNTEMDCLKELKLSLYEAGFGAKDVNIQLINSERV